MTSDEKIIEVEKHLSQIMKILEIPVDESTIGTPHRIAKMWVNEFFANVNDTNIQKLTESMTLFPNNYKSEMVVMKGINFNSVCEHHFLPFSGKITVGYIPDKVIIGLSKIPRVVKYFSKKPQLQEKLVTEIGNYLVDALKPHALFIEAEAVHQCVKCRGAESDCSTVNTFSYTTPNYRNSYAIFTNLK